MWISWESVHISVSCQTPVALAALVNGVNLSLQLITHFIFTKPLCKALPRYDVLGHLVTLFSQGAVSCMLLLVAPSKRTCNNYDRNRTKLSEIVTVLLVSYKKNCSHIMEKSLKSVSRLSS